MKRLFTAVLVLILATQAGAQDPSFSQFFSSPLNINPALTGVIKGKWRVISNYRDQWISTGRPYSSSTVSFDNKMLQNIPDNYVDENFRLAVGGMFMHDKTLGGIVKSNYASLNLSGNLLLASGSGLQLNGSRIRHNDKAGEVGIEHRIGAGFGAIYGNKRVDYGELTFSEQFTGRGFDNSRPNGEGPIAGSVSYFSMSAGLIYNYLSPNTNFDLGVAAFHLNKPRQTILEDVNQVLPTRYVGHANFETMFSDYMMFQGNGIYQYQNGASYYSVGGALGFYIGGVDDINEVILNAGLWYWSENALVPYLGLGFRGFQLGASYDFAISELRQAQRKPKTFELSLIIRGQSKGNGVIPAPWK